MGDDAEKNHVLPASLRVLRLLWQPSIIQTQYFFVPETSQILSVHEMYDA